MLTAVSGPSGRGGSEGVPTAPADHGRPPVAIRRGPGVRPLPRAGRPLSPPSPLPPGGAGVSPPPGGAGGQGRCATKVCVMPVCQPGCGRQRTRVNPARRSRAVKASVVSKASTLR